MTIPFLHYFQKGNAKKANPDAAFAPPPPPLDKPSSERFSKTVMPSPPRSNGGPSIDVVPAGPAAAAARMATPRSVSLASPQTRSDLPPAVALAIEPQVERVISLELADIVPHLPEGFVKPIETIDATRRLLLKASEVEKGMASGRPTVSLSSIHQQVPEIFLRSVTESETTQVKLPFAKVLEEFTKLQVRNDQLRQTAVPQVETPFLKVTLEDNERFGTTMEELETGEMPDVKVEPPTAEAFAAAEPEPAFVPKSAPAKKIPFSIKASAPAPASAAPSDAPAAPSAPTRIAFKLSPNGADAPATESVPASGGPSVPTTDAATAPPAAPTRIPFKIAPLGNSPLPKTEPWLTAEAFGLVPKTKASPVSSAKGEPKIRLALHIVLQALPAFQLNGEATDVPADVRVELPFSAVESQLASGRVSISPAVFLAGIPETYRSLINTEDEAEISLPLQEVLKNLPTTSLRMRDDQVEQELGGNFATPFSAKAEEDAKRLNVAAAPIAKPAPAAEVADNPSEKEEALESPPPAIAPAAGDKVRTPLQVALDTDEKLDAKAVVSHINRMPGVKASAILFEDGLSLAGELPQEIDADALCAMAPGLMQRIENRMTDTNLGALRGMTLACAKGTVTFFMHESLCLAALHSNGEIAVEVRDRLSRVVHEMSRKYSHPV